jgi:hypothetical protein
LKTISSPEISQCGVVCSRIQAGEISGLQQNRAFCLKSKMMHRPNRNGHGTTDCFSAKPHFEAIAVLPTNPHGPALGGQGAPELFHAFFGRVKV